MWGTDAACWPGATLDAASIRMRQKLEGMRAMSPEELEAKQQREGPGMRNAYAHSYVQPDPQLQPAPAPTMWQRIKRLWG